MYKEWHSLEITHKQPLLSYVQGVTFSRNNTQTTTTAGCLMYKEWHSLEIRHKQPLLSYVQGVTFSRNKTQTTTTVLCTRSDIL